MTAQDRWEAVIGLEVHCQLATATKLFCGCPNAFGAPPNSLTCPVCTGQPGALPVLNEVALALGIRAALALGAEVARESRFDRKNYFYCDLPKGYQISQLDRPIARGGGIRLASGRFVRLNRIHLEEDAGKALHDRGDATRVDLNRAGVPLIESVTEADLRSAEEAHEYLTSLKEVLAFAGVSDCDMEKGSLRCDVNVSVRPAGTPLRTKVELKNLNSFKNAADGIEHEIARQLARYEAGLEVAQETRLFDPDTGATRTMRTKEDAHDYRYFPEPDLPPALVEDGLIARQREAVPELPAARRARYETELGLSAYDAGVLTADRELADFFEATAGLAGDAKAAANWIANDVLEALGDPELAEAGIAGLRLTPAALAELIELVSEGAVNTPGARKVLGALLAGGGAPRELVRELGLEQVSDEAALEAWTRAALAGKDSVRRDVLAGKEKALGAIVGPVMKASGGRANPARVREIALRLIREEEGGDDAGGA